MIHQNLWQMFQMNLCKTKKLHYGKYLYKVGFPNKLAGHFRTELQKDGCYGHLRKKLDELNSCFIAGVPEIRIPWTYNARLYDSIPVEDYYDAIELFRIFKKTDVEFTLRCEMFKLNLYTNDRDFVTKIVNTIRNKHIEFWEPDPQDLALLQQQENIIIVNNPFDYEYKITFGKKKGNPSLAKWIEANPNLGKIGEVAKDECLRNGWVKGYYFFVKDKKSLLIAQMIVGDNIQRIDRLVYNG